MYHKENLSNRVFSNDFDPLIKALPFKSSDGSEFRDSFHELKNILTKRINKQDKN
jgi:hypothetical protein